MKTLLLITAVLFSGCAVNDVYVVASYQHEGEKIEISTKFSPMGVDKVAGNR